jgi:hypothetical protein
MMGKARGQLAVTLDVLTDALVLVGQHGVYCHSARHPGKPAMDVQLITKSITDAKELISGVMTEIKNESPCRKWLNASRADGIDSPPGITIVSSGRGSSLS